MFFVLRTILSNIIAKSNALKNPRLGKFSVGGFVIPSSVEYAIIGRIYAEGPTKE